MKYLYIAMFPLFSFHSHEKQVIKSFQFIIYNTMSAIFQLIQAGPGNRSMLVFRQLVRHHYILYAVDNDGWNLNSSQIAAAILITQDIAA